MFASMNQALLCFSTLRLHVHFPASANAARTISEPEIEAGDHWHARGIQLGDATGRDLDREAIRPR
jgi:hypothetical protein